MRIVREVIYNLKFNFHIEIIFIIFLLFVLKINKDITKYLGIYMYIF